MFLTMDSKDGNQLMNEREVQSASENDLARDVR